MDTIMDSLKNKWFLWLILALIILSLIYFVDFKEVFRTVETEKQLKVITEDGAEAFDVDPEESFDVDVTEFENEDFVEL